jgi:hypothetical protein
VLSLEARTSLGPPPGVEPYVMAMLAHARLSSRAHGYARQRRPIGRSAYSFRRRLRVAMAGFRCYWHLQRRQRSS